MNSVKFDFVIHWLWAVVFSGLTLSGVSMIGAQYGWILNYDLASADYIHRVLAALYVFITLICVGYEIMRVITNEQGDTAWLVIGNSGYQLFTYITTLIFIISGVIIWVCMDTDMDAVAFSLYIHEKLTYIVLISVIWHIYMKSHSLIWPKKVHGRVRLNREEQDLK